jgi:hypothetical protein
VATVLALEPDPKQAGALRLVVRDRVGAEFVHVESKDAALEAIRARVPDLILLTALLSPRDESEIADLLRELDGAEHVQTLTIPLLDLGTARPAKRKKRGLLSALTGGDDAPAAPAGCDPAIFADEIANYLQQSEQARADAALAKRTKKPGRRKKKDAAEPSAPAGAPGGASSYWSWDADVSGPASAAAPEPAPEVIAEQLAPPEPLSNGGPSAFAEAAADHQSAGGGWSGPRAGAEAATDDPVATPSSGSSWADPWDVSAPSLVKPAAQAETYLDDLIIPAAAAEPPLEEPATTIDALFAQPAPTTAADALANGSVEAGLPPSLKLRRTAEALAEAGQARMTGDFDDVRAALAATEAAEAPLSQREDDVRRGAEAPPPQADRVEAGLQPRDHDDTDDVPVKRGRAPKPDDFEPDFVPARLPTRAESGALLALQADLARLRQQRESTGTVLGTAKAAQERAAKAAAEAAERARREADIRAEQAAARAREEALAERRAREAAEQRAREEAERRAEAERKAQERAERLAREAADKAREEAAQQARIEHERRLDEERRAREEAERRAAAEREAREQAERRAKEEAARLEREARERQAHAEAERRAREAAEAHAAAERKAREEAERRAKEEAARIAREAERKAKADAERLAREAEQRARAEAERIARDVEARAHEAAERRAQEAERKAQEKVERAAREAERKAHEEAERLARVKAEEIAREKEGRAKEEARAERLARQEAEKRADAERKARLELERRTEAERQAREAAERKAREQVERDAEAARAAAPSKKTAKKKKAAAKPAKQDSKPRAIQDEWGLYDPNAAGFEALFAKLEAIENGEEERVPAERPRAPKPLAMWAVQSEPPLDLLPPRRPRDEFRALVSQFSIPHAVAAVGYATGAKIGKVRVTAAPRPKSRTHDEGKVVILSRKLLKAARREAAAEQRPV